ncbi:hypothetical protein J1614_001856 [Plenodomus biglobosus]|nr:hypothetical protein J1614_001856 [Plenodomus biglobosus]
MNVMVEVIGIISGLRTADQALTNIARQTQRWRPLYDQLFDIKEAMKAAELTLQSWRRKFDIQQHRPVIYMQVLFSKQGNERIEAILGSINGISRAIRSDIHAAIEQALKVRAIKIQQEDMCSPSCTELLGDCIRRIQENPSWSRKFVLSMLGRAQDLETRIDKLHRKVTLLERISDSFLEKEHPDIFAHIKRRPGRKCIPRVGDGRMDAVQDKLLDALAARKDAVLLHRASGEGNAVHIGLCVPQIHRRDFAFLLKRDGRACDVVVRPVKIKAINDATRVQIDLPSAVDILVDDHRNTAYMLPSSSTSAGFEIKIAPANLLSGLEYKDSLSTIIRNQNGDIGSQELNHGDQSALASSIAQGSFRLIGSPWLDFLDCTNIRWRRSTDGSCTSMLMAQPGDYSLTRSLQHCIAANLERRDSRDLTKHAQIFRIGLVLAEIVLKTPVSHVEHDEASSSVRIYMGGGEEVDAAEVAAEVERRGNVFLGNMVLFCLSALQDRGGMADKGVEGGYLVEVVKAAERLEGLVREDGRRGVSAVGSRVYTPRSAEARDGYYV